MLCCRKHLENASNIFRWVFVSFIAFICKEVDLMLGNKLSMSPIISPTWDKHAVKCVPTHTNALPTTTNTQAVVVKAQEVTTYTTPYMGLLNWSKGSLQNNARAGHNACALYIHIYAKYRPPYTIAIGCTHSCSASVPPT